MTEKIFKKRNGIFITGAIMTVFWSVIIGIFNIGVVYLLGIPVFALLLDIILVWVGKSSIREKILLTFLPLPLIALTFFLFFEITKADSETFLIPQDFRGEFVIFYNEPCGQQTVFENGRRIYQLPKSGVLITKFKENEGHLERKFYLTGDDQAVIPEFHWQNFDSETQNRHLFHSTPSTKLTKDSVGVFRTYGADTYRLSTNSFSYTVSNFRYFEKDEKERFLERQQFTEKAGELLKECRQNHQK